MREKPLVLVLDDEDVFLEIASLKLGTAGFSTVTTNDAQDALIKAETLQPDFILSDVYMPQGLSGWEFARALHENHKTKGIKFAFFTSLRDPWAGLEDAEHKKILREMGNVPILSKTNDVEFLADRILKLMSSSQEEAGPGMA